MLSENTLKNKKSSLKTGKINRLIGWFLVVIVCFTVDYTV